MATFNLLTNSLGVLFCAALAHGATITVSVTGGASDMSGPLCSFSETFSGDPLRFEILPSDCVPNIGGGDGLGLVSGNLGSMSGRVNVDDCDHTVGRFSCHGAFSVRSEEHTSELQSPM